MNEYELLTSDQCPKCKRAVTVTCSSMPVPTEIGEATAAYTVCCGTAWAINYQKKIAQELKSF